MKAPPLRRIVVVALALALVCGFAREARAERVELKALVDSPTVELGDTVTLTLKATVQDGAEPADADPGAHSGFSVVGTSSAPARTETFSKGQHTSMTSLVTTWSMRATAIGTFTLGPPTVQIGNARRTAQTVRVKVVPRGQGPPRPNTPPPDPFGLAPPGSWRGIFDFGDAPQPEPPSIHTDPKLALDTARAPIAFLHATVDKTQAVVGEQVTLSVFLYQDPYAHAGQPADVHEATATDFAKRALIEADRRAVSVGNANVGGHTWVVALVRKDALFPLKTGRLAIDPMSLTLPQARAGLRESERLFVDVTEPPTAGRPPGYALGDVGNMSLDASVTPRSIEQDGAVGVTIELRGTGNLPSQLPVPVAPGIEWLDAQTKDTLTAITNDKYGGTRTFSYVVRIHRPGAVDLGEVRLPFFDPETRAYGVAHASIGILDVKPGGGRDAGVDEPEAILPGLPTPRAKLEGVREETYLAERPVYWGVLFGSPLACVVAIGAGGMVKRARARRAAAAPSPARIAKERRAEAEAACRGDDGPAAMGAIARSIEAAVLASTNVNLRGGAGEAMARELEQAGVAAALAKELVDVLHTCEDARFSPDGVAIDAARKTWSRAKSALGAVTDSADGTGGRKA